MIINVGASAGKVGFSTERFWASDGCFCLTHSDAILPKFLYYYLSHIEQFFFSKVRHAGIPTLDAQIIKSLKIPVPPRTIQEKIVDILDRFEALCTNLTAGLPAEIEARKKQYEYYRDKLLTFTPLAES